jgi:hypothetical protein
VVGVGQRQAGSDHVVVQVGERREWLLERAVLGAHRVADPQVHEVQDVVSMSTVDDMATDNHLGEYLRTRRELVRPDDVGLPVTGQRRVAGLRREEVAMLAGISSDHNPSAQVLESLARVLPLDDTATGYLLGLIAPRPRSRARRDRSSSVPESIERLVSSIALPAFVESRHFDVLVGNDLAQAVDPNLRIGENRMLAVFLDPAEQALRSSTTLVGGAR